MNVLSLPIARTTPLALAAVLACACLSSETAQAVNVVTSDMVNVDFNGMANGNVGIAYDVDDPVNDTDVRFRVVMARLAGVATRPGLGKVVVQLEAATGEVALLDAIVQLDAIKTLRIRGGFFRPTFSFEMQTGLAQVPFVNRSLMIQRGMNPIRRIGVDATWSPLGDNLRLVAGLFHSTLTPNALNGRTFDPRTGETVEILSGDLVFGVDIGVPDRVTVHAMALVRATGVLVPPADFRAFATANFGIRLPIGGGTIDFETTVSTDQRGPLSAAGYILGSRAFDTGWTVMDQPVTVVPMARVEALGNQRLEARATLGCALAFLGDMLRVTANQEVGFFDDTPVATTFIDIQAGF